MLALSLVFQVQADTLLGRVINVADGYRPLLRELSRTVSGGLEGNQEMLEAI